MNQFDLKRNAFPARTSIIYMISITRYIWNEFIRCAPDTKSHTASNKAYLFYAESNSIAYRLFTRE